MGRHVSGASRALFPRRGARWRVARWVPSIRYGPGDRLILLSYGLGILGLVALGVAIFTLDLALVGVAFLLAVASFLLLRSGARRRARQR